VLDFEKDLLEDKDTFLMPLMVLILVGVLGIVCLALV
jgi:hypothetical protein